MAEQRFEVADGPEDEATTCEDFGCEDGMTVQGHKYDAEGNAQEQWAPCGNIADSCRVIRPGETGGSDG